MAKANSRYTDKPTKSDIQKKKLLKALEKTLGVVTKACNQTGVNRSTFYEWYNKDKKFKSEVDSIGDMAIDYAETALHNRIKDGSDTAIIFYLKTKGKKRGYVEKTEQEVVVKEFNLKNAIKDFISD
jgi:hypothetical protein